MLSLKVFTLGLLLGIGCCAQSKISLVEAVEVTLANSPDIEIQRQEIASGQGLVNEAAAPFDPLFSANLSQNRVNLPLTSSSQLTYRDFGLNTSLQVSNIASLGGGMTRFFRNGMSYGALVSSARSTDNLLNTFGTNRSFTTFSFRMPLMGGRGRKVVAWQEMAAEAEVQARQLDLSQTTAVSVAGAARSYWRLVAAKNQLEVATDSEERGRQFRDNIQTLIDADRSPRSDIYNVSANLAGRTARVAAAEQGVVAARTQLAVAMGLTPNSFQELPEPADELPAGAEADSFTATPEVTDAYIATTIRNRADIQGARKRERATEIAVTAAKNLFLPRLDAGVAFGYSGLREGLTPDRYLGSLLLGGRGVDAQVGLNFSVPQNKLEAQGTAIQARAASRQAVIRTKNLERQAFADVLQSLNAVQKAVEQLRSANDSVRFFTDALQGEREKLQLGLGSVVEMLTVEDRLTAALSQLVDAKVAYPLAVLQVRLATGTLVTATSPTQTLGFATLTTLPSVR